MRYVALAALLAACTRTAAPSGGIPPAVPPSASGDTLRGIVANVGAAPLMKIVIRPNGGGPAVSLTGDSALLHSVVGLDVRVFGAWDAKSYAVSEFVVRAVGGIPALDGTVKVEQGRTLIEQSTAGFRKGVGWIDVDVELKDPPPQLSARAGSRAWVTTAPDGTVLSWGLIPIPPADPR